MLSKNFTTIFLLFIFSSSSFSSKETFRLTVLCFYRGIFLIKNLCAVSKHNFMRIFIRVFKFCGLKWKLIRVSFLFELLGLMSVNELNAFSERLTKIFYRALTFHRNFMKPWAKQLPS